MEEKPYICKCSHGIKDHGRRKPPSSPIWEYTGCREKNCPCIKFAAEDDSGWPYGVGP